jgi:soluble lytic murein transglycosylase
MYAFSVRRLFLYPTLMKRFLVAGLIILTLIIGANSLNQYWMQRYNVLIVRQATIYGLDPELVWSIAYEETHLSPCKIGKDGEIGLMQVTPVVGREWANETGMRELERQMASDAKSFLCDPENNIKVGCWYLEKIREQFQNLPEPEARMVAAYNAGPSRAVEWNRVPENAKALTESEFIDRIDIPSTRAYVNSIIERYHQLKSARGQVATQGSQASPGRP